MATQVHQRPASQRTSMSAILPASVSVSSFKPQRVMAAAMSLTVLPLSEQALLASSNSSGLPEPATGFSSGFVHVPDVWYLPRHSQQLYTRMQHDNQKPSDQDNT